jgi:hypothetical protein
MLEYERLRNLRVRWDAAENSVGSANGNKPAV